MMFRLTVILSLICIALGNDRIIKGRTAPISEFPYVASLMKYNVHFCMGSLIRADVVLTAAHCILGVADVHVSDLSVRVGSNTWKYGGQTRNIVGMKIHRKYNTTTKIADVGLVKLDSPVTLNSEVQLIKLATGVPSNGREALIAGFGVTNPEDNYASASLKATQVSIISRKRCREDEYGYGDAIKFTMICAWAKGTDACQGDSGAPLVSKVNGTQLGIVSWGNGCARKKFPGVYATVFPFRNWISYNADNFQI